MRRIAVVGASLAGFSTARALRRLGFDGELVLVGDEPHRPYDRPPLSKDFLAGVIEVGDLTLEAEGEDLDITWLLGRRAVSLDVATRTVELSDGTAVSADGIVIATGAHARALPGTHGLSGVHTLRTLDDALALQRDLLTGRRLVVIGAGFIGAETASTARKLGLDVTVVEAAPAPLVAAVGPDMGAVLARLHDLHGVRLLVGRGVSRLLGSTAVEGVQLADGEVLPADVVVVGIGSIPTTGWLEGSGLTLDNGVVCDAAGRTEHPGIVAVGDCAAWLDPRSGRHVRTEHWTSAVDRAQVVAAGLLSEEPLGAAPGKPSYFWSDQYSARIQFAGSTAPGDTTRVEAGSLDQHSFLVSYWRDEVLVAVLGVDQPREFTRWRKKLAAAHTSSEPLATQVS